MQGTVWTWQLADKSNPAFDKLFKKFNKMDKTVDKFEGNTGKSLDKLDRKGAKFTGNLKKGLKDAKDEIPGLNRGLGLLKNPLILGAAAAVGFVAAMGNAVNKSREFNHEFLELKNLNLDKTDSEIKKLKNSILDLSFEKGLDPMKTSKAFFDVQSATGKYGTEVERIVGKVGKFAQIMKADYNTSIEGASKAMGIFGFGASKMDEYLASQFKTVQVGVTSFDQLAKVQTEYSKSAASAGQGFNEANKLFAVFSASEKSVDIAATKTKGAFEDLTKKSTIKGFKKLGVEIFDTAGNTKKLDQIVKELIPKLQGMSDTSFGNLKEEIGGNEGLRGLMSSLRESGDMVLDTFENFNNTKFDYSKALENANGDLETMSHIIDNKLKTSWIKFGEAVTPIVQNLKRNLISILDSLSDTITLFQQSRKEKQLLSDGNFKEATDFRAKNISKNIGESYYFDELQSKLEGKSKSEKTSILNENIKKWEKKVAEYEVSYAEREQKGNFEDAALAKQSLMHFENSIKKAEKQLKNKNILPEAKPKLDSSNISEPISPTNTEPSITGITGAASNVRNVTVNIQNLVREFIVNKEGGTLSPEDTMRVVEEAIIKATHDAELVLSNN